MPVEWTDSAARHAISREDALYAITHAVGSEELEGRPGETTVVYVGRPHAQSDRYLEVIVAQRHPRTMVIFHVMELSDLYRHLVSEGE
ncbi:MULTISPECIES: hypothetical protein [unclassified Cellulomonas]|uniref:hypothetical protein n=1 Tax=unclassified Cellulomonas TaxID=2620175 RepID=UPI001C4F3441|nr:MULTISPECIES: hypothetical protein [unclassified Cellulomonas]MBW0254419.1 hypothetical protein [Cellulomonas sp. PS-H5]MCG7284647.1 hypothetical protein [Cellulomonas sp. ACRRI]